ncbi:MAG TPA: CocE/NonD family hydrolase [Candidatus Thermoplasmatota archaeon]|nr:CocE/NonD family hydrolase [Candidatus Thermoplasmatota archaeon]
MRRPSALVLATLSLSAAFAGCLAAETESALQPTSSATPYKVPDPDETLKLLEESFLVPMPGEDGVDIHVRVVRPDVDEPVPVVVQFTPYTAPGRAMLIEPLVRPPAGAFVNEFVRRGFAFAYADVRGTGDSGGCLDLRGKLDVADAWNLTEHLGTQPWSNGKVGFIGASYPGSEAHIAAIANNPHLGGVIPVVASTSFYHYHHKGGVPYENHLSTNSGYTAFATAPTVNPQYANWLTRQVREAASCDQATHLTVQLDQSGAYDTWWADRNLRPRVDEVQVPVLMAQGLADWNVKPDHIATWWNELSARKTLIAGQWPHQFPEDAPDAYGDWWEFAAAFFDETLRATPTGLFDEDTAYVQGSDDAWYVYQGSWPPADATWGHWDAGEGAWNARPAPADAREPTDDEQVIVEFDALGARLHLSGTPYLTLDLTTSRENVHVVAVLEREDGGAWVRENHGYLNPIYREGIEAPKPVVPGEEMTLAIDMYPQEDVFDAGTKLRLVLRSVDGGNTVAMFDEAQIAFSGAVLHLPVAPEE